MDKMELEQRQKKLDVEAREALVPYIYAMSDMHGEMEAFEQSMAVVDLSHPESKLILCGDYMSPPDGDFTMIREIMRLQDEHPGQIIALMGNHEYRFVEEHRFTECEEDPAFAWMKKLPFFYETPTQIFVHAGVDEEAGDLWKVGTPEETMCEMFPWNEGEFMKDVIAGHTDTFNMAQDESFHDVYWDGASHYYLDGTTHKSGQVPVLKYDIERERYTAFTFDADGRPEEYEPEPPRRR